MKLDDIINQELSLYNFLGKTGGSALPYTGKEKTVDTVNGPLTIWKRKRITEEQRGGEYDPAFAKFGNPEPSKKENKWGWAKTTGGDSVTVSGPGRKTKKVIARKVGDNSIETIDDEGNKQLHKADGKPVTGKIDHKRMHTGVSTDVNAESKAYTFIDSLLAEVRSGTGTGLGGSGATEHPMSGPSELEYDLTKVEDEFKGKDTRADIKKSKAKRITLKKFLDKRTNRETDRVTAAAV